MTEKKKGVFQTLNEINVNDKVEHKKDLTYLSWSWAWSELMKQYPDAVYEIKENPDTHQHYWYDPNLGYEVRTSLTLDGVTREMWLPVMDPSNHAMKAEPYTVRTRYGKTINVAAASMMDINKTIMRCLTKNIAMFGLGLYIYAGEDIPEPSGEQVEPPQDDFEQYAEPSYMDRFVDICKKHGVDVKEACYKYRVAKDSPDEDWVKALNQIMDDLTPKGGNA